MEEKDLLKRPTIDLREMIMAFRGVIYMDVEGYTWKTKLPSDLV